MTTTATTTTPTPKATKATKAGRTFLPGQPKPPAKPRRKAKRFDRASGEPPEVGPFGVAVQDPDTGRWKRSLTPEGWAELDRWMKDGPVDERDGARDLVGLLVHVHPMVHRAAKCAGMTREEVYQWCYIGVVRAMQTFDPATGYQFVSYAPHWMRQYVGRATEGLSKGRRYDVRVHSLFALAPNFDDENDNLLKKLGREDDTDPDTADRSAAVREAIRKALPDERHRRIVMARYGLDGRGEKSLDEVGSLFGLTRERVRQIVAKADERLRRWLWPVANQYLR